MIGQYLLQTNETCYIVLQEFKTLKIQIFHQLNKAYVFFVVASEILSEKYIGNDLEYTISTSTLNSAR
jgi:hypothetical protein